MFPATCKANSVGLVECQTCNPIIVFVSLFVLLWYCLETYMRNPSLTIATNQCSGLLIMQNTTIQRNHRTFIGFLHFSIYRTFDFTSYTFAGTPVIYKVKNSVLLRHHSCAKRSVLIVPLESCTVCQMPFHYLAMIAMALYDKYQMFLREKLILKT